MYWGWYPLHTDTRQRPNSSRTDNQRIRWRDEEQVMTSCVQFWQGRVFMASLRWLSRPSSLLPQQAVTERPSM